MTAERTTTRTKITKNERYGAIVARCVNPTHFEVR